MYNTSYRSETQNTRAGCELYHRLISYTTNTIQIALLTTETNHSQHSSTTPTILQQTFFEKSNDKLACA